MKLTKKDIALVATSTAAGVFLVTSLVFLILYVKSKKTSLTSFGFNRSMNTFTEDYIIAVVNESTTVSDAEVIAAVQACQIQIDRDFFPAWGVDATLTFYSNSQKSSIPASNMQLILIDNADVANALGYHTLTSSGMPLAKVFVQTSLQAGEPWSLAFSHEILEMIIDPWANLTVFIQSSDTQGAVVSYEVCDPCQAEAHAYQINGIIVSDFVLPQWFGFFNNGNKYDFNGFITQPGTILPGGYALVFQVPNSSVGWKVVNGMQNQITGLKGEMVAGAIGPVKNAQAAPCGRIKDRHVKETSQVRHIKH